MTRHIFDMDLLALSRGYASDYSYRNMSIKGVCEKCGNKEPWSFSLGGINRAMQNIFTFLFPWICLLFVVSLMTIGSSKEGFLPVMIMSPLLVIAIIVLFFGYRIDDLIGKSMQKKLDLLPEESFPILVVNGKPLRRIPRRTESQPIRDGASQEKKPQKVSQPTPPKPTTGKDKQDDLAQSAIHSASYCRKCGKAIPKDSTYCPYCGERVKAPDKRGTADEKWLSSLTCSATLCILDESKLIMDSGLTGSLEQLSGNEYFCPVLTIKNLGSDTPLFSVSCYIDGVYTKPWKECSIQTGQTTKFVLSENNAVLHMLVGEHTITYKVEELEIFSFTWTINE